MSGAIFGLLGVIVGALLSLVRDALADRRMRDRHARYLAIRVVCALDSYVESCADVVSDDGLSEGQRNAEGYLEVQIPLPPPPVFSGDLDWKSIDHDLMYRLLSLPSDAERADRRIDATWRVAFPPDFEELFEERQLQYAKLGLTASALSREIREKYHIAAQELGEWDPVARLTEGKNQVESERRKRYQRNSESPSLI